MTEVEFGGVLVGAGVVLEAGAAFIGGVVEHELVVSAGALLAVGHGLAFDAGQAGGVAVAALLSGKPGLVAADGGTCALGNLVVLGISLGFAVVQAGNGDGAVDVAFEEVDEDFLADTGDAVAAPIGAGNGGELGRGDLKLKLFHARS